MARHSSSEEYTFAELLALIEEHRHDLVELTRIKLHDMHLTLSLIHI